VVFKGQTHSLSHEQIDPILCVPLLQTIRQLRTFLGVTGFCRTWIPSYAALARPLFTLLLILLFGPYNECSLQIYILTVQHIQLQLLVKEYSPLPRHEPSILYCRGPWRLHGSTPETSTTIPIPHHPIVNTKQLDESSPL
jgi:hypothetical protein